ncbi:MAG: hypothetical protein ABIP49_09680 [Lysobacterales bacterium]
MKATRVLPILLALAATTAHAQYAYGYDSRTGDPALDAVLDTINLLFNDEPDYYVDQIVYETQAPPIIVREYIIERHYAPADVYMIGELAQASGQPFATVANRFDANRGRGWGVIARDLGIKPGSARFHALKNGTTVFVERGKAKRAKLPKSARNVNGYDVHHESHPATSHKQPKSHDKAHGKGKAAGKNKGKEKH